MSLTKYLWTALGGAVSIIVLLLSAWGHDMTARVSALDQRQDVTDQRYATLLVEMQDLREHIEDLKKSVDKRNAK